MFIGQNQILEELSFIIPRLKQGVNENILLRGASGYGKTKLAFNIANLIDGVNAVYYLPDKDGKVEIVRDKRIHIIDEAHLLKEPEFLYPLMDSKNYIFIFASNEAGELKEPLVNRCFQFIFKPYTDEEIQCIIQNILKTTGLKIPKGFLPIISKNSNGNPRLATKLCQRLINIFYINGVPEEKDLEGVIEKFLQIKDGLQEIHIRYLDFLNRVKHASLDTISNSIKIDKATIKFEIEPVLLYKGLIQITSKGRTIV